MKRKFIFFGLILALRYAPAQVRTSLYEGFTGENCGPCSSTDTLLNAVLSGNSTLVIPIKWEIPILSAPTNSWSIYQSNKSEINWRYRSSSGSTLAAGPSTLAYGYPSQNTSTDVITNGINTAPTGRLDGQHQWVFGANSDHPIDLTNAVITSAQTQTTNFRIAMTPVWSPSYTNCVVSVTVLSTTSFTSVGSLMFRLCLVERIISFPNPPGINGEKKFYDAVRRSYPTTLAGGSVTAMGTTINGTWTPGQTQIFTVSCAIPASIRDLSQMAFVGFIQDDGDRKIYQASRTAQPAVPNDIKVVSLNVPLSCSGAFTPSFVAENLGQLTVNSLTIAPFIDGVAQSNFIYNGNIAGGSTVNITLPGYTMAHGKHTFSLTVTGVSGGDINTINNSIQCAFGVSSISTSSVVETFVSFPPPNWYALNYDFTAANWAYASVGGFSNSVGSAKYDFWNNYLYGDTDELFLPVIDLTGKTNIVLSFDLAYAQYNTNSDDILSVLVSTNCGTSWTSVYSKHGNSLATAPAYSIAPFSPGATEWRRDTVYLNAYANQPLVLVKFSVISGFGNNLYLDNVNLVQPGTTGTNTSLSETLMDPVSLKLYPNPNSGLTELSVSLFQDDRVSISVSNSIGQEVYSLKSMDLKAGDNLILLNGESWAPGVYSVNLNTSKAYIRSKLFLMR